MGVQRALLVDVVVLMLAGQSQTVLPVHPVVGGDDSGAGLQASAQQGF